MLYPQYPEALAKKYGAVRRARFSYIYTASCKRLTDLYQEAGRAILGWGGTSAGTAFKNTFNRGANGGFQSGLDQRLTKAVEKLLPAAFVRWYSGETAESLFSRRSEFCHWRPWADLSVGADTGGYLFLPPFPLARDVVIFASRKDGNLQEKDMPVSDFLQPPVLAGITRSVYDLIAEIPRRGEASWSVYDDIVLRFWDRKGPYLFPKMSRENYGEFSGLCLDAGLVISPDYDIPSVVPWQANKGDFSALCSKAT